MRISVLRKGKQIILKDTQTNTKTITIMQHVTGWFKPCEASWFSVYYANKHVITVKRQVWVLQDVVSV